MIRRDLAAAKRCHVIEFDGRTIAAPALLVVALARHVAMLKTIECFLLM